MNTVRPPPLGVQKGLSASSRAVRNRRCHSWDRVGPMPPSKDLLVPLVARGTPEEQRVFSTPIRQADRSGLTRKWISFHAPISAPFGGPVAQATLRRLSYRRVRRKSPSRLPGVKTDLGRGYCAAQKVPIAAVSKPAKPIFIPILQPSIPPNIQIKPPA